MVPHPVMLGFVNGLAIIICKAQFEMFYVGHGEHAHLLAPPQMAIMIGMIILTMFISHFFPKLTKAIPRDLDGYCCRNRSFSRLKKRRVFMKNGP